MSEARYDAVAGFYTEGWTDTYDDPILVSLFELLGQTRGNRILDVACGHGRISRELARRGAEVVGVDISGKLLEVARTIERQDPLGVEYVQADIACWDPASSSFDAATCCFGLSDIDDLSACVGVLSRALREGGRLAFCMLHPCFAGGGAISGSWPPDRTYYDEGWWLPAGAASSLRRRVGANHRTLSTYLNAFAANGLLLDKLAEPAPPETWT